MTVLVANVDTSADTFGQWVSKTNIIATSLSNVIITTNSNTTTGNAAITGTFSANVYFGNTLSGGNTSASANLTISSNAIFSQNAYVTGRLVVGSAANVQINSGNSTFRVLTVNTAAGNTLSVSKITSADLSDFSTSSVGNGQFLVYSSANSYWYNTNNINLNANTSTVTFSNAISVSNIISVGNSSVNLTINSTMVAVSGSPALLKVYYANNQQAFP
jgi:hypothetical protein